MEKNADGIISIAGLDKAEVLAALFNGSHQQGLGFLDPSGSRGLSVEDARAALAERTYFDYFRGRVLKVDLSSDSLDTRPYNRDCGQGAAEEIIEAMRPQSNATDQILTGAEREAA